MGTGTAAQPTEENAGSLSSLGISSSGDSAQPPVVEIPDDLSGCIVTHVDPAAPADPADKTDRT